MFLVYCVMDAVVREIFKREFDACRRKRWELVVFLDVNFSLTTQTRDMSLLMQDHRCLVLA